jgi:hypothetical protein
MRPNRGARKDSAVPLKRNTGTRIIVVMPSWEQAVRVQVMCVVSQPLVPMRIINVIGEVE